MTQAAIDAPASETVEPGSAGASDSCRATGPADAERTLVINADDFGRSADINHAIALAHREGILTSASLMVSGTGAEQAVAIARQMPSLAVGLHLVLADGVATLPPAEIPHLVNDRGEFRRGPGRAGVAYFFSRSARRELQREIRAQFEQFARTGLPLSHVDGHCHLHLHPVVFDVVLPLAEKYEARAVRIVHDGLGVSWMHERRGLLRKLTWSAEFGLLGRRAHRRMAERGTRQWPAIGRTVGLMHSGNMTEAYVLDTLARLPAGASEMYFHPSFGKQTDQFGPGPMDLATLLSPLVRRAIEDRHIRLATFPQIALQQRSVVFWQADSGLLRC